MTYPITIIDNFFEDPDAIVNWALSLDYHRPETGNWPGIRSKMMHELGEREDRFFQYFGEKVHMLFHDSSPDYWNMQTHFQRILPFSEEKYDPLNRGWIHQDLDTQFGGIVYLTKDPEPDTGTSIYKSNIGFAIQFAQELKMKEALYKGEEFDLDEYYSAYEKAHEQYEETVKISNVYNRFVLFNSKTHHGVQTFGTKERLTLNFFGLQMTGKIPPLLRYQ
jgi:hypothetical protein|tara:strand:+ start:382 stop:1044 length:663 start_codon:yes stop_codon:yes gene_type:complete